jgi:hypothetical protein
MNGIEKCKKPKVYRKFNASTDIVITFQTLFLKSYFQDDNNNKLSLRLNYVLKGKLSSLTAMQ